jgi:hypothetical protein
MSPSDPTTPEVRPAPSVEQRLGYALGAMACLQQIAAIADEPDAIPLFNDLRTFAALAAQFSWATESHLRAIRRALPASCTNVDAPDAGGQS